MKHKYLLAIDENGKRRLYDADTELCVGYLGRGGCNPKKLAIENDMDEITYLNISLLIGDGDFGLKPRQYGIIEVDRKPIHGRLIELNTNPPRLSDWVTGGRRNSTGADTFSWEGVDIYWVDKYDCITVRREAA
jgi:hypothetical protein